ncbi:cysteine methyltransferase [Paenibacillus sp. CAA11]|uniref:methylated-DNA--[protein]-cysteine S-methyltransferase n=1 Tax=Paenibacillus sp. CAA11 TaxID=1532905 RepID=UPI000D3B0DD1|nr:methylated-DNA--[protein]-cysteine S-methyltransferase [Paenibacillus sp. CAA11]AWB44600.1 cysteine methyltransferase [Paenibacillus sp. CAA11]
MNHSTDLYWTRFGRVEEQWTLFATNKGICRVVYPHMDFDTAVIGIRRYFPHAEFKQSDEVFETFGVLALLEKYFAGQHISFDSIPLDLGSGTEFQREVWSALRRIPYGAVCTYREVAEFIGRPRAVRAVGTANGANPVPVIVPCHRVVGSNSTLVGYRGGLQMKERLLHLEGVNHVEAAGHVRFQF